MKHLQFVSKELVSLRAGGFTLIELMVVVSIIGLLASILLSAFTYARASARDATRVAFVSEMKKALELYYSDHGYYPKISYVTADGTCDYGWCTLQTELKNYFIFSKSPTYSNNTYYVPSGAASADYFYDSNPGDNYQTYGFMTTLETRGFIGSLAQTDGGYYNTLYPTGGSTYGWYEVGQQPRYCEEKYGSSVDGDWWAYNSSYASVTTVCMGGN